MLRAWPWRCGFLGVKVTDLTAWMRKCLDADLRADGIDPATVEIIDHSPILWASGTGGVSHAALLRLPDGRTRWWVHEDMSRPLVVDILRERIDAYADALAATRRLLAAAEAAGVERIEDAVADWGVAADRGDGTA